MNGLRAAWVSALFAIIAPLSALAKTHVVVVGVNQSTGDEAPLQFADDDALRYTALLAPWADQIHLHTVLDAATARAETSTLRPKPPTRRALLSSLKSLAAAANDPSNTLYFVFVGHGHVDANGGGALSLADGRFARADLYRHVFEQKAYDRVHTIIDACNAFFMVAGRGGNEAARSFHERLLKGSLHRFPHVGVLLATAGAQSAYEWARVRGGVFSHALRSALAGAADVDGDGRVQYGEAHAFVLAALSQIADPAFQQGIYIAPPRSAPDAPILTPAAPAPDGRRPHPVLVEQAGHLRLWTEGGDLLEAHRAPPYRLWLPHPPAEATVSGASYAPRATEGGFRLVAAKVAGRRARGPTDAALARGYFRQRFDPSFFNAFASLAPYPVRLWRAPGPSRPAPGSTRAPRANWSLSAGARVASTGLPQTDLSAGLKLRGGRRLGPGQLIAVLGGRRQALDADGHIQSFLLGVGYELPWFRLGRWSALSGVDFGYAHHRAVGTVDGEAVEGTEPLAGWARARLGCRLRFDGFRLDADASLQDDLIRIGPRWRHHAGFGAALGLGTAW